MESDDLLDQNNSDVWLFEEADKSSSGADPIRSILESNALLLSSIDYQFFSTHAATGDSSRRKSSSITVSEYSTDGDEPLITARLM